MKKLSLFALFALFTIILTACGGSKVITKFTVNMSDFKYDMANYTVSAGKEITLDIKNEGAVKHEFVIMNKGLTIGDQFGDEDEENIFWEVEADPGETKTVTFTAPTDVGEYEVICGTPGHFKLGMASKLTVVP